MTWIFRRRFPLCGLGSLSLLALCCSCGGIKGNAPRTDVGIVEESLQKSVSFGERHSGSETIGRYAVWIREKASSGSMQKVRMDSFSDRTPEGEKLFRNIECVIPGRSSDFLVIGAHYDTKYFEHKRGFVGANDGASGVAALHAMIKAVSASGSKPPLTLRFVFFDGEECLIDYSPADGLHGSRRYVKRLQEEKEKKNCRGMILLDMIGDKDLKCWIPANTTHTLADKLLAAAKRMGNSALFEKRPETILDDHVPFLKNGIDALVLIDFEYGEENCFWHTLSDTPDRVSSAGIAAVADTVLEMIWHFDSL